MAKKKKGGRRRAKVPVVRTLGALAGLSYYIDMRGLPVVGAIDSMRKAVGDMGIQGDAAKALALIVGTQVLGREMSKAGYNPAYGPVRLF